MNHVLLLFDKKIITGEPGPNVRVPIPGLVVQVHRARPRHRAVVPVPAKHQLPLAVAFSI